MGVKCTVPFEVLPVISDQRRDNNKILSEYFSETKLTSEDRRRKAINAFLMNTKDLKPKEVK